jgi:hypothetical protein
MAVRLTIEVMLTTEVVTMEMPVTMAVPEAALAPTPNRDPAPALAGRDIRGRDQHEGQEGPDNRERDLSTHG